VGPSCDLLPLLPPPLPPPGPLLPLEEEEEDAPGEEAVAEGPATVTLPWLLSPLEDRLSTACLPSVSGGGDFNGADPLLLLLFPAGLLELLVPGRPDLALAIPDRPVGLVVVEEGGVDLPLPLWAEEPSLVVEGPVVEVLVNAAHPVRPLDCEDPLFELLDDAVADALTSVLLNAWKLVVSSLGFISGFFTSESFTTGAADDVEVGEGFCGAFWLFCAMDFICLVHRAQYHTSRGSFTSLSVTWGL